jgi:hypothetical protein
MDFDDFIVSNNFLLNFYRALTGRDVKMKTGFM